MKNLRDACGQWAVVTGAVPTAWPYERHIGWPAPHVISKRSRRVIPEAYLETTLAGSPPG